MPYITSAERIGLETGRREGRLEGQRAVLRRLVQARFGTVPEALGRQIDAADDLQLDQLIDRIGAASTLNELGAEPERPA